MREQFLRQPFGTLSIRRFILLATSFVVALFAYIIATSPTTNAATDLTWKGPEIVYKNDVYSRREDAKKDTFPGLAEGTKVYLFYTGESPNQKANVISFDKNGDPATSNEASFAIYDYTPPATYTNQTGVKKLSLTPQTAAERQKNTSSCVVQGIGWIVCPLTTFLSKGMDWLLNALSAFLTVRPVQTDQETALYRAWSAMRNFANIAFVIAFMIVIYSQLTNFGLSNYGLKQMFPRLIVAAIFVNISYWICAIAVDLSNIAGYSIQDILEGIRNNLVGAEGNGARIFTWESVTGFILSGGTAAAAAGVGLYAFAAGAGGGIFMLLPILLGVLIAVLVALLIMAARQALITILIIVAPLAFVAYLLPNTEKYFKKWTDLFTTMLFLFPMFAIIFSGAQLAGDAIVQNADSINLIILGMAVKIAPVVITPFLIKLSGSLLGKVAGIVNNPGKGLVDRTRGFAQERADQHKARVLANGKQSRFMGRAARMTGIANRARNIDAKKRDRTGWQKANEGRTDANWTNTDEYAKIHGYDSSSSRIKDIGEAAAQNHYAIQQQTNAALQELDTRARVNKITLDTSNAKVEANWDEIRAGNLANAVNPTSLAMTALANAARTQTLDASIEARRAHSAKEVQQEQLTTSLIQNQAMQQRAGGISAHGADAALAAAIKDERKAYGDSVADAHQLLKHFNFSGSERQDLAMGRSVTVTAPDGSVRTFDSHNAHAQEAAIEAQLRGQGNYENNEEIIMASGSTLANFKTTIQAEMPANKLAEKAAFLGGQTINAVGQGLIGNSDQLNHFVAKAVAGGKIKAEQLATMEPGGLKRLIEVGQKTPAQLGLTDPTEIANFQRYVARLGDSARDTESDILKGRVSGKAQDYLEDIKRIWP